LLKLENKKKKKKIKEKKGKKYIKKGKTGSRVFNEKCLHVQLCMFLVVVGAKSEKDVGEKFPKKLKNSWHQMA